MEANKIEPGVPYIVKWTKPNGYDASPGSFDISNPVFADVTFDAEAPTPVTSLDGKVAFIGNYSPISLEADDKAVLFLGSSNNLLYPSTAMSVGSFRANFQLLDGVLAGVTSALPLGDIDGDGEVTVADVTAVANIAVGRDFSPVRLRFVDGNGELLYQGRGSGVR